MTFSKPSEGLWFQSKWQGEITWRTWTVYLYECELCHTNKVNWGAQAGEGRCPVPEPHKWKSTGELMLPLVPRERGHRGVQCSSRLLIKGLVKWESGRCYLGYGWGRKLELNPACDRLFEDCLYNSKEVELTYIPWTPSSTEWMDNGSMVMDIITFHLQEGGHGSTYL